MAGEKYPFELTFSFRPLPMQQFSFLQDKETLALLMKWSMLGRISAQAFSFDQSFYPYNSDQFALVRNHPSVPLVSVSVKIIPCTKVSMDLFDPIYSCGILMPSGHVVKCLHDVHPDYDELRQMLQEEDSQHYDVIGKEEREEFIFLLFKHICLGGELCQYEDVIDPYISTTKKVYKDLISVQKDPETKKISVVSTVLKVCVYVSDVISFVYMSLIGHIELIHISYGVCRLRK
uniref:Cilia- and flagella-associated protein 300 n=1 Tax=Gouania willdenowi TaxID=441366 RepID=A0A8C5DS66_GOUWI